MNKKTFTLIPIALGMLLLFTGCVVNVGGGRTLRGTGSLVTRDIDVADFNAIDVGGNFRVVYRQASTPALTVVMQENLFNHLETSVRNGNLQITTGRNFETTSANRPTLYVYAPYLTGVDFSGAVTASNWDMIQGQSFAISTSGAATLDISLEVQQVDIGVSGAASLTLDLDVERLDMEIAGAANVRLSGSANTIDVDGSGAFNLRAGDLQIEGGRVNVSGAANVYLSTLENISVITSGLARVRQAQ